MNIADYICYYLAKYDIKYVYGYPGAAILPLIESINNHPQLSWVLTRHENTAALAASAQAKLTQKLSVCMTSSGPGATNLITGILDADLDRAPVLFITGLIPSYRHGIASFQDLDQVNILKSCCSFSALCVHPLQIIQLLPNAVAYALKNRRVAHLAIASDVQLMDMNNEVTTATHHRLSLMPPPEEALELVAHTINEMSNIIIAVGPRAREAGPDIEKLAETLNSPIICSFAGKGVINENHPNYFGVLGLYGQPANQVAFDAIKHAELVIAFGIDDLFYFVSDISHSQKRELIQCEPDITSVNCLYVQKRIILGNLKAIASQLSQKVVANSSSLLMYASQERKKLIKAEEINNYVTAAGTVHQSIFFQKLNFYVNKLNLIIAFDIGDHALWALKYLKLTYYQHSLVSNRIGTMGFCLPALIAAKLNYPDHLVVGICGDGGLQMVLGELNTAVQMQVNIFLIVIENARLQRVVAQQGKSKAYGTYLKNPDFEQLAISCGVNAFTIEKEEDIDRTLIKAFAINKGPVVINVKCDPEIFAPMINWS